MRFRSLLPPLLTLAVVASGCREARENAPPPGPDYVGGAVCADCHEEPARRWQGSHHDLAMQEPTAETVLGDFDDQTFSYDGARSRFYREGDDFVVETDGPDGELSSYRVAYAFGVHPLQQYLVELPGGRLQALSLAWDARDAADGGERWYHLYPDDDVDHRDPLHWTGRFQSWNRMCASCHSTGVSKGYDVDTDTYDTKWSDIDVSCEACHGPGSLHVAWASNADDDGAGRKDIGLVARLGDDDGGQWEMDMASGLSKRVPERSSRAEVETCAPCHSRRVQIAEHPVPGEPLLDAYRPSLLDEGLYHADGQMQDEVYVYGSFLQSKMYREGVTCQDCHDPHSLSLRAEGNAVCASCHLPERFDTREHHFHERGTEGAECVSCHMPATTFMGVDARRDHGFRVPRPETAERIGAPEVCTSCHVDRNPAWAALAVATRRGAERAPHFGEALFAGRQRLPNAPAELRVLAANANAPGIARATALSLFVRNPSPDASTAIRAALSDPDPLVRLGAVEAAQALAPATRPAFVAPLLEDETGAVRMAAARALAPVPPDRLDPETRRRVEDGLAEYRDAQHVNADWPEAWMNLGLLASERREPDRAQAAYRTALRLDPNLAAAYVNLADLYRSQGRDAEGLELLERGLSRLPESADLHHSLGLLLVRLQRVGEAVAPLARAAEHRPEEPRYAYVYAVALESIGALPQAVTVLEKALERHPDDVEILSALVSFHREAGELDSALVHARRLRDIAPDDPRLEQLVRALETEGAR